jgi:hypothetical protein
MIKEEINVLINNNRLSGDQILKIHSFLLSVLTFAHLFQNFSVLNSLLPGFYSVLNDKISFSVLYKKIEIRFAPNIPDLGDLATPNAIVSVNKLFKLFYTIHYDILCSISMTK